MDGEEVRLAKALLRAAVLGAGKDCVVNGKRDTTSWTQGCRGIRSSGGSV